MEAGIQLGCYLRDYQAKALRGRTILELGSGIGGWGAGPGWCALCTAWVVVTCWREMR